MKNVFFNLALDRAARLLGKPGRLARLLAQFALKFRHTNWRDISAAAVRENFSLVARLLQAHVLGHYRVSFRLLLMLAGTIVYFVNPLDLIPDVVIGVGLTDDFAVLTWVFSAAREELVAFADWEGRQTPVRTS